MKYKLQLDGAGSNLNVEKWPIIDSDGGLLLFWIKYSDLENAENR